MDLTGRVAIVTGGASGIGRGIALVLAQYGADVTVADLNLEGARAVAREVEQQGRKALGIQVDVTKKDSTQKMASDTLARFGKIDILVTAAGIIAAPDWQDYGYSREIDWDLTFQVNVKGMVFSAEAVSPSMKERRYGKIINIASIAGRQGRPYVPHYSASKAAVINWTQALALQLAPYNINVNAICPGLLWTPLWEKLGMGWAVGSEELKGLTPRQVFDKMVQQRIPLKREQTPEDIGYLVAFLASDLARNITGQSINVDGGSTMN